MPALSAGIACQAGKRQRRRSGNAGLERFPRLSATGGIGWDFKLTDELKLRPIFNFALGNVTSDQRGVLGFDRLTALEQAWGWTPAPTK